MPVAYSGIHERQKGVRDRHENDPRSASASWPPLSYGIVPSLVRAGNRRGKYFPFQHSSLPPTLSLSLYLYLPFFLYVLVYVYMSVYTDVYVCNSRHFAHVLFSLCARRHEKGLTPCSCEFLARLYSTVPIHSRWFFLLFHFFFCVILAYFTVIVDALRAHAHSRAEICRGILFSRIRLGILLECALNANYRGWCRARKRRFCTVIVLFFFFFFFNRILYINVAFSLKTWDTRARLLHRAYEGVSYYGCS